MKFFLRRFSLLVSISIVFVIICVSPFSAKSISRRELCSRIKTDLDQTKDGIFQKNKKISEKEKSLKALNKTLSQMSSQLPSQLSMNCKKKDPLSKCGQTGGNFQMLAGQYSLLNGEIETEKRSVGEFQKKAKDLENDYDACLSKKSLSELLGRASDSKNTSIR